MVTPGVGGQSQSLDLESVSCALCESDDGRVLFSGPDRMLWGPERFILVQCRKCGLLYVNPRPVKEHMGRFYPVSYKSYSPEQSEAWTWFRRISIALDIRDISKYLHQGSRILEIGCATGDLLREMRNRGYERVEGLEFNPQAVRVARERHGLSVKEGEVEKALFPDGSFDLILMRWVLEHLPDPVADLQCVTRWLDTNGVLYAMIPDPGSIVARLFGRYWSSYDLPRHLYNFPRNLVPKLAEKVGLKVERTCGIPVPNDLIMSLRYLLEEKNWPPRLIRLLSLESVPTVALFTPLSLMLSLFNQSGRVRVVFRKRG